MTGWRRLRDLASSPVRAVPIGFLALSCLGTVLLSLPAARGEDTERVPFTTAAFHAVSAACVTGLSTVDTSAYWSTFGQAAILLLVQLGGIGTATLTALLALVVAGRLGLRSRLNAASVSGAVDLGTVRQVLFGIARVFVVVEAALALVLAARFALHYDEPVGRALWLGVFHGVSAFNNAGFALFGDNLVGFATDEWITVPVMVAVVLGGLGFPVILEVLRRVRVSAWSVNTRVVLLTSALLLVGGAVVLAAVEWDNPATLGALGPVDRVVTAVFMSVNARTAGFNTVDYGQVGDAGLLATIALMVVGGGSASTAGGIKVGTLAVLLLAIWAEARGHTDTPAFDRRLAPGTVRQALAVVGLYATQALVATMVLLEVTDQRLARSLFEVVSATSTVGLSTNLTPELPPAALWVLTACMYLGRVGPATLVAALALQSRPRRYRLPVGRPLVG